MNFTTFAAEVSFFHEFLRIVPRTTSIGHEDGQCKAGAEATNEETEHTGNAENYARDDGDYDDSGDSAAEGGDDGCLDNAILN